MAANYQRFLEVLRKWPINPSKGNRDFGLHLRRLLEVANVKKNIFPGDERQNEKIIKSLNRLANNKCSNLYPKVYKKGASGLDLEQLNEILSDSYQEEIKKKWTF